MPGGAEAVGSRFDVIYPLEFGGFVLTRTGDGLGPQIRYATDFLENIVHRRMYYQQRAIWSGSVRPDSNQEYDLVTFVVEFFYWFSSNSGSPNQGVNAREFPFWGGLFQPPGALNDQIEPILNPLFWKDQALFNFSGFIHGFFSEPEYSIQPQRVNQVTAHCEVTVGLIVEEV